MALGQLDARRRGESAAQRLVDGELHDQFVVDPFQAGAGTSHNMNANEVIANLANEALGGQRGVYDPVNPNDHVNMAQSTNDVIPTVTRVAALQLVGPLLEQVGRLAEALEAKATAFDSILKAGRTHLQDAVPVRLGQEFGGYAQAVRLDGERIAAAAARVRRLGIGGTAAGTGLNAHPGYHQAMVALLSALTGIPFASSGNLFESMQRRGRFHRPLLGAAHLAVTLTRIANDLRLLSSAPPPAWPRSCCPPCSPARRSCQARSTR